MASPVENTLTTINDLPNELLERIFCLVLQSDILLDFGTVDDARMARKHLLQRRKSTFLNKRIFGLALPAYFRTTQLDVVIGKAKSPDATTAQWFGRRASDERKEGLVSGTFEEHPLFFEHTRKLRVELGEGKQVSFNQVRAILVKCSNLVEVVVCTSNLDNLAVEMLLGIVTGAVGMTQRKEIKVRVESADENAAKTALRKAAESAIVKAAQDELKLMHEELERDEARAQREIDERMQEVMNVHMLMTGSECGLWHAQDLRRDTQTPDEAIVAQRMSSEWNYASERRL